MGTPMPGKTVLILRYPPPKRPVITRQSPTSLIGFRQFSTIDFLQALAGVYEQTLCWGSIRHITRPRHNKYVQQPRWKNETPLITFTFLSASLDYLQLFPSSPCHRCGYQMAEQTYNCIQLRYWFWGAKSLWENWVRHMFSLCNTCSHQPQICQITTSPTIV